MPSDVRSKDREEPAEKSAGSSLPNCRPKALLRMRLPLIFELDRFARADDAERRSPGVGWPR